MARAGSRWRAALPALAGLVAAAATFAVVAAATSEEDPAPAAAPPATAGRPADQVRVGRAVFARMGCGGCHTLEAASATAEVGPNLDERLPIYDREALIAKIVDPYPGESPGMAVMPEDFGLKMRGAELEALVAFLLASTPRAP